MLENLARYVYEVYRCKSVSAAADKLFISQPAMSAAIHRAEKQLGAPIFNRKTLPFSLTAEGKVYMEAVEKMLQLEEQTANRIRDLQEVQGGSLRIGTSTHISFYAIPRILELFHRKYPQTEVNILLTDTDKLYDLLDKELADLIFICTDTVPSNYNAVTLLEETLVVAMPSDHPNCEHLQPYALSYDEIIRGNFSPEKMIRDMSLFHGIEFIYSPPNTNIHKKRRLLFGDPDISPFITASAGRQQLNYNLMRSGFGALLTTDANLATMPPNAACMYFVLQDPAAKQSFFAATPSEEASLTSAVTRDFIATAQRLFQAEQPLLQLIERPLQTDFQVL